MPCRYQWQCLSSIQERKIAAIGLKIRQIRIHICLKVHRLVCIVFYGPCPADMEARHLNGVRSDNSASNLRWRTRKENSDDKIRHGTLCTKEQHGRAKITEHQAKRIRQRCAAGESQVSVASDFGIV